MAFAFFDGFKDDNDEMDSFSVAQVLIKFLEHDQEMKVKESLRIQFMVDEEVLQM
jgi:hypothetical protein